MSTPVQAGFFAADITPSVDMYGGDTSRSVRQNTDLATPFQITASYWRTDETAVAILGGDLAILHEAVIDEAAAILRETLKVRLDYLALGASHTHSSGPCVDWHLTPDQVERIEDLTPAARRMVADELGVSHPFYRELIRRRIVDTVACAARRAQEVRLVRGRAEVPDVAYSRRQRMKDGRSVSHAGVGNPEILEDGGPIDRELLVLGAQDVRGRWLGAIVNFGCHATVDSGRSGFSADWPYYMRETLRRWLDPGMVIVFLNGCCGDVTQLNSLGKEPYRFGDAWARVLGQRVGFAAVDALARATPEPAACLRWAEDILTLDYRPVGEQRYRDAVALLNAKAAGDASVKLTPFLRDYVLLREEQKIRPRVPCRLGAVQIGNALLLANQMECFSRIALDLKRRSPFPFTLVSELTNGHRGYLPTADVYGPEGGGYECLLTGGNYLEKDAARKVLEAMAVLAARFSPETPDVTPVLKPGKPWADIRPTPENV